jgi:Holliday junction DNA helicase RuvB
MDNETLLQVCPICLKGPVVRRDKPSMPGLSATRQYVCETCGSVLHALEGGRYRYTAISSQHPDMQHQTKTVFDSLDDVAYLVTQRTMQKEAAAVEAARQERLAAEEEAKRKLQPLTLDQFLGQEAIKDILAISIEAAKARGDALGHILLCGSEGCGKRTLAHVIANETSAGRFLVGAAQEIEKPWQLASILSPLNDGDIVFIDAIHRVPGAVEQWLCPAMQDFLFAETTLRRFTLIGATDQPNRVSPRLRRCFEHIYEFEPYDDDALAQLVQRRAEVLGIDIEDAACWEIGRGAKGTIGEVERILDQARDYAEVRGDGVVTLDVARWAVHGTAPTTDSREPEPAGLTSKEFEDLLATLFRNLGYQNVRLTSRAGDERKDIVVEWAEPLRGTRTLYVECKHWQAGSVGRGDVEVLHSAVMANPQVDEGIIVTTGGFTDGAVAYAKQVGVIQLIDREKLQELMATAEVQPTEDMKSKWRRMVDR